MNTLRLGLIAFCIFFIIFISNSYGQISIQNDNDSLIDPRDSNQTVGYWIGLGLGKCYFGPTFLIEASVNYNSNILSVRRLKADEFQFSAGGYNFEKPALSLEEFALMYGRLFIVDKLILGTSLGVAYNQLTDRGNLININDKIFEEISQSIWGIAFEAKIKIEFSNFIGISVSGFGNLNKHRNFYGGLFELNIGVFN